MNFFGRIPPILPAAGLALWIGVSSVAAANNSESVRSLVDSEGIQEIEPGLYQIGSLLLNRHTRQIEFGGHVNMQAGLVEVFACTAEGKVHESVLVVDVEPVHLQVALLLLGLEPGHDSGDQSDIGPPDGDPVINFVRWHEEDGAIIETREHRAEDLVWNVVSDHVRTSRMTAAPVSGPVSGRTG